MEVFIQVNAIAILIASIAGYALGAIWYMPRVFGTLWMESLGKSEDDLGNPAKAMTLSLATTLVTSYVLAVILSAFKATTIPEAITVASLVSLGIHFASSYSDSLFCDYPLKLILIQGGYRLFSMNIIAMVLVWW